MLDRLAVATPSVAGMLFCRPRRTLFVAFLLCVVGLRGRILVVVASPWWLPCHFLWLLLSSRVRLAGFGGGDGGTAGGGCLRLLCIPLHVSTPSSILRLSTVRYGGGGGGGAMGRCRYDREGKSFESPVLAEKWSRAAIEHGQSLVTGE